MQRGCEALAAMVSEAEPPTLPPAAKRRRTGMDGGSVAHLRVVWQNLESAVSSVQAELAGRLAAIEAREAALAVREGFCGRLEAELSARGALLEAQIAAATAQAAGAPPPADVSAQAAAAVQVLQALAADGGLPTEVRSADAARRQHKQQHAADAAAAHDRQRHSGPQQQQLHAHEQDRRALSARQLSDSPGSRTAGGSSAAADNDALQALGRELRAAGVISGGPGSGGLGGGDAAANAQRELSSKGDQPTFSQHSHHSTMSHATAIGNPNDSPDSPRSHLRYPSQATTAPPSPLPQLRGRQQPLTAPQPPLQYADASTQAPESHFTPGLQSRSGSPEISAATGPSSCRFSDGGRKVPPRSPSAAQPHNALIHNHPLHPGGGATLNPGVTLNLSANPGAVQNLGSGAALLAQLHFPRLLAAASGDSAAASTPAFRAARRTAPPPAGGSIPKGIGARSIGRIDSADGSSAHGSAHHAGRALATSGTADTNNGGVRIRLGQSASRLDLVGLRNQQQGQQQGQHGGKRRPSDELRAGSSPGVVARCSSADEPLVVADARQPGLDSLANVAAADADGADLPLLPASSKGKNLHPQHSAAATQQQQHQPPSPQASCRSRAGSVAAEDLVFSGGPSPTLQQPQTLRQAVKGEAGAGFPRAELPPQGGASRQRGLASAAAASQRWHTQKPVASKTAAAGKAACHAASGGGGNPNGELPLAFSKTLDYKSCDHILCLTKDMARQLLPPAPHSCSATGSSCQMQVELEDPAGRLWPMTYRSVPARYSYEFRAGWKAFAAHWGISTGHAITLVRNTDNRFRLRIEIVHGVSAGVPGSAAKAAKGKAGTRATSSTTGGGGGGAMPDRRNSGGSVAAGGLNPGALNRGGLNAEPEPPAGSAAMAPLLAAVQQAAVAEQMMEP